MVRILKVKRFSRAWFRGIRSGDCLESINGREINDVLDYRFRLAAPRVEIVTCRGAMRRSSVIRKPEDDIEIGLEFETPLMDGKHSCRNKCIFCFIDQNPPGMRQSCYFKDDDSRLSFLHGNYITMTNLSQREVERIIEMHISPVNVSVHTTNPELRCMMMNNRFAGESLRYLRMFADAGIRICAQVVLCRGINDGAELERTMRDLESYLPALDSVSVVPAGLTKHRDGLYPLSPYTPAECSDIIDAIDAEGDRCEEKYGRRIFYPADEFFVKAGRELPGEDYYGDFSQLEDGVGMLTSFEADALREIGYHKDEPPALPPAGRSISAVTGYASYEMISRVCRAVCDAFPGLSVNVIRIRNDFFGESVTVSGLLTGRDILNQAKGLDLGETLLFPSNALRAEKDLFLDGMTPGELSEGLG
ncbi:MAG: DUF512 domain-containing protein, partial [Clostridia bacterium]|nr:DUF512 domain-containing protein [Clostridia bacterium]